jgi:hypothetical protein
MKHRIVTHFTAPLDQPNIVQQNLAGNIIEADNVSIQFVDDVHTRYSENNGNIVGLNINAPVCLTGKLVKWLNYTGDPTTIDQEATNYEYFEMVKLS